jgi:putative ABC transport system permease protein
MHALLHDLRFALRMLAKSPAYTFVAVLTLALAIGANTAIFSAVNAVLLRPLPYPEPDRMYVVTESQPDFPALPVSYLNYVDYRDANTSFEQLGVIGRDQATLSGKGEAELLLADLFSHEVLSALEASPLLGRNFLPEEDLPNGPKAVILSHDLWTRRYAADPAILGQTLTVDGTPRTVVGVMPQGFLFLFMANDMILPIGSFADEKHFSDRNVRIGLAPVGRLKPGVTREQALADLQAIGESIAARFPANFSTCRPALVSITEAVAEEFRASLLLLMGAVICVLLIAAANLANLMLERAMTRQREMGIRAALGAGRWRLIRQLLVESTLLAVVGGAFGLLLALWGVDLLSAAHPRSGGLEIFGPIAIDRPVLAFTVLVALGTGLLFGLVPAIYASRQDLAQALKDADQHATSGGRHLRARNFLVVAEVAVALALLVTTVLAVRGLVRLQTLETGFAPEGLLHVHVSAPETRFKTAAEARQFWAEIRDRVAALPGVTAVTATHGAPIVGASLDLLSPDGEPVGMASSRIVTSYASDEHFIDTLKVPLLAGRKFGPQDVAGTPPVLIIDEALADNLFPDQDPIGRRVHDRASGLPGIEVVGVVGHVMHFTPDFPPMSAFQMYYASAQLPEGEKGQLANMSFLVRSDGEPHAIVPQIRGVVAALDPDLPLHNVTTVTEAYATSLAPRRFTISLLGMFAGLALLLASVGLYAVMASAVAQRTHELGVRMALGAQPRTVVALVVRQGMTLVAAGVVLGLFGAVGLTRLLTEVLSEDIEPFDPLTCVGVTAVLALVSLLATYIPARRATHIDPMVALRQQ